MAPGTVDRRRRPWRCPYDIFLCCLRRYVVAVAVVAAGGGDGGGVGAAAVVAGDPSTPQVAIRIACHCILCHQQSPSSPWSADRMWEDHTERVPWDLCPKTHFPCMV